VVVIGKQIRGYKIVLTLTLFILRQLRLSHLSLNCLNGVRKIHNFSVLNK
jgi:hypothetical protein